MADEFDDEDLRPEESSETDDVDRGYYSARSSNFGLTPPLETRDEEEVDDDVMIVEPDINFQHHNGHDEQRINADTQVLDSDTEQRPGEESDEQTEQPQETIGENDGLDDFDFDGLSDMSDSDAQSRHASDLEDGDDHIHNATSFTRRSWRGHCKTNCKLLWDHQHTKSQSRKRQLRDMRNLFREKIREKNRMIKQLSAARRKTRRRTRVVRARAHD